MTTRAIIRESLQVLDICGLKPGNQTTRTRFVVLLQFAVYVYFFIDIAIQLVYNWGGLDSTDCISELGMLYQVLCKMSVILIYEHVLVRLLSRMEQFWPLDRYGSQLRLDNLNLITSATQIIKLFFVLLGMSVVLYAVRPLFSVDKILPLLTYHPNDRNSSPQYEVMYFSQVGILLCASPIILSFDCLFISCILYVVAELKLVKEGFLTIRTSDRNENSSMREIIELINHHNLVLECIKDLDTIYSLMLLSQFLSSLLCICGGLLSLIEDGFPPDLQHLVKYATFVMTILSQLFIYCLAGSYLITESESVSEAVFQSDWWTNTQPQVRRAYVMVIQRANKTEKLTSGGMFVLNLESFTRVVRTSFSFFTLVNSLYSRTGQNQN